MSKYQMKNVDRGMRVGHCMKCAKKLDPAKTVWLELDQRTNTYHDFGGVPENLSQGAFEFGVDCAETMRKEARGAVMVAQPVQQQQAQAIIIRHPYAPLFDDADLARLARINAVRDPYGNDIARRIIHDQQFVDLSERYDPIEATVDAGKAGPTFGPGEIAAFAGLWASAALFAVAAWVA